MKKILSLLAIFTISSPCAIVVNACNINNNDNSQKFDIWNLSTWTEKQKAIFSKTYLDYARNYSSWSFGAWLAGISPETNAFYLALSKINDHIDKNMKMYISDKYEPWPNDNVDMKTVFAKGIKLHVWATHFLTGDFTVEIKGNIGTKFDEANLSSWGEAQEAIINKAYLSWAQGWYYGQDVQKRTWNDWVNNSFEDSFPETRALNNALDKINPKISFWSGSALYNTSRDYVPWPFFNNVDVARQLAKGIMIYIKGINHGIRGNLCMNIKGQIAYKN